MPRYLTLLKIVLALATLNAAYLCWRFILVHEDPSAVGTSLCSFTETIDCDKVLSTPQARAFFFPNATLGFGFLLASLIGLWLTFMMERQYWRPLLKFLQKMLILGAGTTLIFWYLLLNLPVFCVLCPVNHISIYLALILVTLMLKDIQIETDRVDRTRFLRIIGLCAAVFFTVQLIWLGKFSQGGWDWWAVWNL
ncbi:MAG: hypothetical protein H6581_14910 [Bacteroidia bacterium]|nr:hypothetical protein [Bacteroidia bacterium]